MNLTALAILAIGLAAAYLIYDSLRSRAAPSPPPSPGPAPLPSPGDPLTRSEIFGTLDRLRLYYEAAGLTTGAEALRSAMVELIHSSSSAPSPPEELQQ